MSNNENLIAAEKFIGSVINVKISDTYYRAFLAICF